MAKLIRLSDGDSATDLPRGGAGLVIGQDAASDIALGESTVSPRHASLREENNRWYIRDEGSRHGTFVNDRRIKDQGLHDGDVIELGIGGPALRFEAAQEEREKGNATTAGRLKQYYEQAAAAPPPEPIEGAGKIAVPVAARGVLFAIGGIALVALGALWVARGSEEALPEDVGATPSSPTAFGGPLFPLQRASRTYWDGLDRMRSDAERERAGAPRRSRTDRELQAVVASLQAGVGEGGDSVEALRAELEARIAEADRLEDVAREAAGSLFLVQTGYEVDGHYFPGPTGTGFLAGDGGVVVTSRQVVAPDSYIRTAEEVALACALDRLAGEGEAPVKVISVWAPGSTPAVGADGALDPASATMSSRDGSVEEAGYLDGETTQPRAFGCPDGGVVESQHVEGRAADLALLRLSGDPGPPLPLAGSAPGQDALVLLTGYPRGLLGGAGALAPWWTHGPVTEVGDRILFDAPVLAGTHGSPLLDAEGRVVGVGVTTRDGRGVALPAHHVRTLLDGS